MVDFILDQLSAVIAMVLITNSSDLQPSGPGPVPVSAQFGIGYIKILQKFYFENRPSMSRDTAV